MYASLEGETQTADGGGGTSVQPAGNFNLIDELAHHQLTGNGSQELLSGEATQTGLRCCAPGSCDGFKMVLARTKSSVFKHLLIRIQSHTVIIQFCV